MYQDDKGNFQRTEEEEHVFWGMRLLKIGFILLIICFAAYFIASIIEIVTGLDNYSINMVLRLDQPKIYAVAGITNIIYNTAFTGSIYVLGMGTLFLSRLLPEPVKKSLKIIGILYLILIPLNMLKIIITYSYYAKYSYIETLAIYEKILYTNYSVKIIEFLILVVIAMMLAKELRQMNEMQRGKNGTVVLPGILLALFIFWLAGGIMYYSVINIPDPYDVLEPVIIAAIYLEGISQIFYSAIAVGVFIALLIKTNKIEIPPLAAMNHSSYY